MSASHETPWDKLSASYLDIEEAGHEFPIPHSYLPSKGEIVFDLGCGVGTHMRLFLTKTDTVYGLDYSVGMVRAARSVAPVARGDARSLPYADASFDYLWSRVVISCVPEWDVAFEEALRVVKPGGRLLLLVSNRWSVMTPFRTILSALGRYSEGYIKHLSSADFTHHEGAYPFRVVESFATQKDARSDNPLFRLGARIFYGIDRALARILPWWGGDLCVVIERSNTENKNTAKN